MSGVRSSGMTNFVIYEKRQDNGNQQVLTSGRGAVGRKSIYMYGLGYSKANGHVNKHAPGRLAAK
jgi:hypothetical protein